MKQKLGVTKRITHWRKCLSVLILMILLGIPFVHVLHYYSNRTLSNYYEKSHDIESSFNQFLTKISQINRSILLHRFLFARKLACDTAHTVLKQQEPQSPIHFSLGSNIDHPRILIGSDEAFAYQGWPGSGTLEDPYRIENLNINGSSATGHCIHIYSTTVHFIIANCNLFEASWSGIYLSGVRNAILRNNTCVDNDNCGIRLYSVHNSIISNNTCNLNSEGIHITSGGSLTFRENICSENEYGIHIESSVASITIEENTLSKNDYGLSIRGDGQIVKITENICSENHYGLFIHNSTYRCDVISNHFLWNSNMSARNDGTCNVFDGNFWSDYLGLDLNFDGYGDTPYVIPGHGVSLDYRPRGFTYTKSLQLWCFLFFVGVSLVVAVILGWRLLLFRRK
ncbi:MAG: nitrous oxide reductase family maturation protein NosD [Promethearchaeota archaeon]